MTTRFRAGVVVACAALAMAACDGAGGFTGAFGTTGIPTGTGNIQGQVTADGTGQGGVPVILVNQDSTVTGSTGAFAFTGVPSDTYQISVRVPIGFTLAAGQTSPRSVVVTDGATTGVTFILQSTTIVP